MQTPDDEQLEAYLKGFHPISPEPLPTLKGGRESRHLLTLGTWIAAIAAILIVGAAIVSVRSNRAVIPTVAHDVTSAETHVPLEPLTMRNANAWLARAPSFKAAVDDLAFRDQANRIQPGEQSAIAVLNKEKIKL